MRNSDKSAGRRLAAMLAVLVVLIGLRAPAAGSVPGLPRPEPVDSLTVMSFNIASQHGCVSTCLYDDPAFMLGVVADLIVDNGVDIAGLQEIERLTNRHNGVDMVTMLSDMLTARGYPMYSWFESRDPAPIHVTQGDFGIALFSTEPATFYSSTLHASSIHASSAPVQEAVIDVGGTVVRVFNTHAYVQGSCDVITPGMVDPVQDHLDEFTVLIGDFNDHLGTPCMLDLQVTHESACAESGDPSCDQGVDLVQHPNNTFNVDHVIYRVGGGAQVSLSDAWVDQSVNDDVISDPSPFWVSDHYPIFGRFQLPAAEPDPTNGDADCDGMVGTRDVVAILEFATGLRTSVEVCPVEDVPGARPAISLAAADVDGDGNVSLFDALVIARG